MHNVLLFWLLIVFLLSMLFCTLFITFFFLPGYLGILQFSDLLPSLCSLSSCVICHAQVAKYKCFHRIDSTLIETYHKSANLSVALEKLTLLIDLQGARKHTSTKSFAIPGSRAECPASGTMCNVNSGKT